MEQVAWILLKAAGISAALALYKLWVLTLMHYGANLRLKAGTVTRGKPQTQQKHLLANLASSFTVYLPITVLVVATLPSAWDWKFNFLQVAGLTWLGAFLANTWYYCAHRYMHHNKWVFRHFHAKHHRVHGDLNAYSLGFGHWAENAILSTPFYLAWTAFFFHQPEVNVWNWAVPIYTIVNMLTVGHVGTRESLWLDKFYPVALLRYFPFPSQAAGLHEHELHHTTGNKNYGAFFLHWDTLFGSAKSGADAGEKSRAG